MKFKSLSSGLGWLVLTALCVNTGQAALLLEFSADGGSSFATSFTGSAGQSFTIDVFARQTGASTQLSSFGLINMGFSGTYDTSKATILSASVDGAFPNNVESDYTTIPGEITLAGGGPLVTGRVVAAKGASIRLAQFRFEVTTPGVSFTFGDRDRAFGFAGNFDDMVQDTEDPGAASPVFPSLDTEFFGSDIQATHAFSVVSAVPEPSGALLLIALAAPMLNRRRGR